ncbi:MAG: serine/threonine-protein kinase [Lysobacteraceae bacterium]
MGRDPPATTEAGEHQLREAAERIADGVAVEVTAAVPGESGRVLGNLSKLAALRSAFQRLDNGDAETTVGSDAMLHEWGHLRIVEALGSGGFGSVYRAYDPLLEREVALKLRREDREQPMATRAYIDEARRLARVRHPNVLAVHGAGIHDGRAGLWSDLIEGESLEQRLSHGPLSRAELLVLARQLLEALGAIHRAGLVHGDLKAANVMFDGGHAVLMDFGAAHAPGDRPRQGSVDSMAPELLAGERGDARSDLYSLGALLRRAALPRGGSSKPRIGRRLASLVQALMAEDPARRPDVETVAGRLRAISTAPARRRRRLGVGLVIASLLVGLLASLVALQRVREARERSDRIKNLLVSGIQNAAPTRQNGPSSLRAMLDYLAAAAPEKLDGFPEALADMRVVIGVGMSDLGDTEEGLALAEAGLEVLRAQPGVSDLHLANAYNLVAIMRGKLSRVADARDAGEQAMRLFARLPADSRERLTGQVRTRSLLGNLLSDEGDWLGAVAAHQANLADRTTLLGADAAGLAVDEYNLGSVQTMCGDYQGAVRNFERATARLQAAGAGDSARMAYVLHGQAVALMRMGRLQESATSADQAEALYRRIFGTSHVAVRRLAIFRTEWLRVSGDPQQAYARYQEAVADPETQALLNTGMRLYAVDMLMDLGRHVDAQAALMEVRANLRPSDAPQLPYLDAIDAWVDLQVRGDDASESEMATVSVRIREQIARTRSAGYGQLPQVANMEAWVEQLRR